MGKSIRLQTRLRNQFFFFFFFFVVVVVVVVFFSKKVLGSYAMLWLKPECHGGQVQASYVVTRWGRKKIQNQSGCRDKNIREKLS